MNWYVGTDWSVIPAGGNSLRQVFVRLEDYERLEGEVDALYATKLGQVMIERDALAAELAGVRSDLALCEAKGSSLAMRERVKVLEMENIKLAVVLHGLYDDNVDYLRLNNLGGYDNHWLVAARIALGFPVESSVAPIKGGQLCHLCNAVHDLMSACPPKEMKGEPNG